MEAFAGLSGNYASLNCHESVKDIRYSNMLQVQRQACSFHDEMLKLNQAEKLPGAYNLLQRYLPSSASRPRTSSDAQDRSRKLLTLYISTDRPPK